jgi:A/G-specific adenine glycosylase
VAKHRSTNLLREAKTPLPLREETDWFRETVLEWAVTNGRDFPWRAVRDEYHVAVTEVLLQQTTATAVAKVWSAFFIEFPDWQALANASPVELQAAISVLGLGAQRTRRLQDLARWVVANGGALPQTREQLEAVPGIGQYVASAVLAICHGEDEPLLDVNMARVLERFFGVRELADIRDDPWLQIASRRACGGAEAGWAVLDLAAAVCRARVPTCGACPLLRGCQSKAVASAGMKYR